MRKILVIKKDKETIKGITFKKARTIFNVQEPPRFFRKQELKSKRFILVSEFPELHFSTENIVKSPEEIIELQLREKLRELGLFETTPAISFRIEEGLGPQIEVSFCAVNYSSIKQLIREVSDIEARLQGLYPEQLAIAFLTLKETDENTLSVYISQDKIYISLTGGNRLYFLRTLEVNPLFGPTSSQIEEALLAAIDFGERLLNINIKGIISYGPKRELLPDTSLTAIVPSFSFIKGIEKDQILDEPELFGALFVPEDFSLLPRDYRKFLWHLNAARKLGFIFLFISLINYGIWFFLSPKNKELEREIAYLQKKSEELTTQLNNILTPEEKQIVKTYIETKSKFDKTFRLDVFLYWLNEITPPDLIIRDLAGGEAVNKKLSEKTTKEYAQESPFPIFLEVESLGSLKKVQKSFDIFLEGLQEKISIKKNLFSYDDKNKKGILKIYGEFKP
ncbi:hypothetical protein [Thermodesulfatator atlanticus]